MPSRSNGYLQEVRVRGRVSRADLNASYTQTPACQPGFVVLPSRAILLKSLVSRSLVAASA